MTGEHSEVRSDFSLMRTRGYTLIELLLVILIISLLAGFVLIASGSGTQKAEAAKVLSGMEAMKAALLMESQRSMSRTTDPLGELVGQPSATILNTATRYTDTGFDGKYFNGVRVTREGRRIVLNLPLPAGEVGPILRQKASDSSSFSYDSGSNMIKLTIK
ncbi:MAG: prepilin-type N-terminal cleavage/methylation domain-containing protein [Synergistaceae bacterium]|jgi:general secretion pathway protein G|nr:prepilin-type N-terminal cleavage/methylation domain-containing protein [Synergistaceae bacterium]